MSSEGGADETATRNPEQVWELPEPLPMGFRADVLPGPDALDALRAYMEANKPSLHSAGREDLQDQRHRWRRAGAQSHTDLWQLIATTCRCPTLTNSVACPTACAVSAEDCLACDAHRRLAAADLAQLTPNSAEGRNARLAKLLSVAPLLHQFHELAAREKNNRQGVEDKSKVIKIFQSALHCGDNRGNCVLNLGGLALHLPAARWTSVQLSGGWALFWTETRKVAKAVNRQPSIAAKDAALSAMRTALGAGVGREWLSLLGGEPSSA